MKIIGKDNYNRENVADVLIAENVDPQKLDVLVDTLNFKFSEYTDYYYMAVKDDYRLWRGMEDLV